MCLQSTDYIYGAKRAFHNEIGRFIEQGGIFTLFLSCSRLNLQTFFVLKLTRPDSTIHTYHLDVDKE